MQLGKTKRGAVRAILGSLFEGPRRGELGPLRTEADRAVRTILACRTAQLGTFRYHCETPGCGQTSITAPNRCGARICPSCAGAEGLGQLEHLSEMSLPVPVHHVVLTLPAHYSALYGYARTAIGRAVQRAGAQAVLGVMRAKKFGILVKPGITALLHTAGQRMFIHVHVHLIVTAGGMAKDGTWKEASKDTLLPYDPLKIAFKRRFLIELSRELHGHAPASPSNSQPTETHDADELPPTASVFDFSLEQPPTPAAAQGEAPEADEPPTPADKLAELDKLIDADLADKNTRWNAWVGPRLQSPAPLITYLVNRRFGGPIADSRIIDFNDTQVRFFADDYHECTPSGRARAKVATLPLITFAQAWLSHVPPPNFHLLTHYGLYATACKDEREALRKTLPAPQAPAAPIAVDSSPLAAELAAPRCPACHCPLVKRVGIEPPKVLLPQRYPIRPKPMSLREALGQRSFRAAA